MDSCAVADCRPTRSREFTVAALLSLDAYCRGKEAAKVSDGSRHGPLHPSPHAGVKSVQDVCHAPLRCRFPPDCPSYEHMLTRP